MVDEEDIAEAVRDAADQAASGHPAAWVADELRQEQYVTDVKITDLSGGKKVVDFRIRFNDLDYENTYRDNVVENSALILDPDGTVTDMQFRMPSIPRPPQVGEPDGPPPSGVVDSLSGAVDILISLAEGSDSDIIDSATSVMIAEDPDAYTPHVQYGQGGPTNLHIETVLPWLTDFIGEYHTDYRKGLERQTGWFHVVFELWEEGLAQEASEPGREAEWILNPSFAHWFWQQVLDSPRLDWTDGQGINPMALDVEYKSGLGGTDETQYFRRADSEYGRAKDWVTYIGLPGENSPHGPANAIDRFETRDIFDVLLKAWPYTRNNLMTSWQFSQHAKEDPVSAFVRVPMDRDFTDTAREELDVPDIDVRHTSSLMSSRATEDVPEQVFNDALHLHMTIDEVDTQTELKTAVDRVLDVAERADRRW